MFKISNTSLELEVQEPGSVYRAARFDWTGQITQITFKDRHTFCTDEVLSTNLFHNTGRGLYNEFGIQEPVGFDDCPIGGGFLKIGVGVLTKDSDKDYDFFHNYPIEPGRMSFKSNADSATFTCEAETDRGYAYFLKKSIQLENQCFIIQYQLRNKGIKPIRTTEYIHNFLAIDHLPITERYQIQLPFQLDSIRFHENVNPDGAVVYEGDTVSWQSEPEKAFFLSMEKPESSLPATWSLVHRAAHVGIREICDFEACRINLWGAGHVVSPEVFYAIDLPPGGSDTWQRKYEIFEL